MIDNPLQVERLIPKLQAALPLVAGVSSALAAVAHERLPQADVRECRVTEVHYAGDAGGIMCKLVLGGEVEEVLYVSMTHLTFRRRHPLAREIAAYQKHRNKRLRLLEAFQLSGGAPQVVTYIAP
jgi:hypothetical protein